MAILYYCGLTQIAAMKMAWLMKVTMGTTAIETLGAASNIFLHGVCNHYHCIIHTINCHFNSLKCLTLTVLFCRWTPC